jgi:hypothetical protein
VIPRFLDRKAVRLGVADKYSKRCGVFIAFGAVVQLVRIPACHAGGRGFESRPLRHLFPFAHVKIYRPLSLGAIDTPSPRR